MGLSCLADKVRGAKFRIDRVSSATALCFNGLNRGYKVRRFKASRVISDVTSACTDSPAPVEAQDSLPAHPKSGSPAALPAQVESLGSRPTTFRIVLGLGVGIGLIFLTLAGKEALSSRKGAASAAITPAGAPEMAAHIPAPAPNRGASEGDEIRILAGSNIARYQDHAGKIWSGDRYFTGGTPDRSEKQFIYRTLDSEIYRVSRQGDFTYDIPLKPGVYELRLHFAETFFGP